MADTESPRADVELTEAEREALWAAPGEVDRAVASDLADRLAAAQTEVANLTLAGRLAMARAESAEAERDRVLRWLRMQDAANDALIAERDDLRARLLAVETLADELLAHRGVSGWQREAGARIRAVLASPSTQEASDV
jgi:hypothetical protein